MDECSKGVIRGVVEVRRVDPLKKKILFLMGQVTV